MYVRRIFRALRANSANVDAAYNLLPRLIAPTLLISGRTCGTSCPASPARSRARLALHVDSFDADSVRAHCVPSLLDPVSFLQGCPRSWRDAVCCYRAAFVLLVGASVTDAAVPVGWCMLGSGVVRPLSVCFRAAACVMCC
jgi:hypothetical protein